VAGRGHAVAVVEIVLAASLVWVVPGARPATAEPQELATETRPLVADFDGDGRDDLFWYGPGVKDDHLWLGRPSRNFVGSPQSVRGSYLPLVGDFDGDRRGDVLWYGPGAGNDVLWSGRPGGSFAPRTLKVRGTYQPLIGDFNGDARGDVLWYGPGGGADVLWLGRGDRRFSARAIKVRGTYEPLVGDFNGDGPQDVLWYGPGTGADVLWLGRREASFKVRSLVVRGDYRPLVGDFNGDGPRDVLWYGRETGRDVAWFGHPDGRFTARPVDAPDDAHPFTGDFNGDGRRDIFWYGPGTTGDTLWPGTAGGHFGVAAAAVRGAYQPVVGDFGGDGPDDVLWWAPGPPNDTLWFGRPTLRFTSRSTTVDLAYARAAAIRPEALTDQYDPYGFVAHAFGPIEGHAYTNSLEAFQHNYARGFRVFECDQVLLADGTVLVAHDGLEASYGLGKPFQLATWADLAGRGYLNRYTILRSDDLLQLLVDHPDVFLIPDPKYARPAIYRAYVRTATQMGRLDLLERIIPHVADQDELDALRVFYPLRNYVLALYHSQAKNRLDDAGAIDFVRRNRTPAVMMWWKDLDPALSLAANGRQSRRFRPSFADGLKAAGAVTYVHSLDDQAAIRHFWELGIGVYSDEPFPPLDEATHDVRMPNFNETGTTPPA
jgi:glycerophosphoryl diester phosphodiesterase